LLVLFIIFVACVLMMKVTAVPTAAQSAEERELEDTTPKHLPIKVKLQKEKEKGFKDLGNDKWAGDLVLELTNTGDKAIYLLHFTLVLPEIRHETGYNYGFVLHYGRVGLGDLTVKAEPDDVPIKPGETHVFQISKGQVLSWEKFVSRGNRIQPKKVILYFGALSFGDGTGFEGTDGSAFPPAHSGTSGLSPLRATTE
jgi:hypothetical protein